MNHGPSAEIHVCKEKLLMCDHIGHKLKVAVTCYDIAVSFLVFFFYNYLQTISMQPRGSTSSFVHLVLFLALSARKQHVTPNEYF